MDITTIILKFIPAIIPVVFYYVPKIFITKLYKRHLNETFIELNIETQIEHRVIQQLDERFDRIISYVAFLSIVATSIAVLGCSGEFRKEILHENFYVSLSVAFILYSLLNIYNNHTKHLRLDKLDSYVEQLPIYISAILIFKFI
jgi:hypothetical protein